MPVSGTVGKPFQYLDSSSTPTNVLGFHVASYKTVGGITSVSMSRDGKYAAVSGHGFVTLLNSNASAMWTFQTNEIFNSVSISGDGTYVAAGTEGSRVYMFDSNDGRVLWIFRTDGPVLTIKLSRDDRYVAAGIFEGVIYLLQRDGGGLLWSYKAGNITAILSVAISDDGSRIVAGSANNKVILLSSSNPTPMWTYETEDFVRSVAITSNGEYLAAGTNDNHLYLFSSSQSDPLWSYKTNNSVRSVALSSTRVACGSYDGGIYCFDITSNNPRWRFDTGDMVLSVSFSNNDKFVVGGGANMTACLLDADNGSLEFSYKSKFLINSSSISQDGLTMVIGGDASAIIVQRHTREEPSSVNWINQTLFGLVATVMLATTAIVVFARRKLRRQK
jgi:WD40 repeat protein